MKAFTCAKTKEINAQLQVENSFFPRFGRSRNSEGFSKPTTTLVTNAKLTSKLTQNKFGNTVESILDGYNNGHENGNTTNGHHNNVEGVAILNNANNHSGEHADDESDDEEEQEMKSKHSDNTICIINSNIRPPVLHTDL